MTRWFVYVDIDYYPDFESVEADTPEGAAEKVLGAGWLGKTGAVAVFPITEETFLGGNAERVERLRKRLDTGGD
jgi:hypothetical protein